jgi:thiosulfate/3-mercaptopyruvate sulfurtransferase
MSKRRFLDPSDLADLADLPANTIVLDARPLAAYLAGHLPAARPIELVSLRVPLRNPADLAAFHGQLERAGREAGLVAGAPVLVYDAGPEQRAARSAWMLEYAGLEVMILRSGFGGWLAAGHSASRDTPDWQPSDFSLNPRPDLLSSADDILAMLNNQDNQDQVTIIDARSREEYHGQVPPPGANHGGHIPGAVQLEWKDLMDGQGFKNRQQVQELLAAMPHPIPPERPVVVYCNSGARSAVLYHVLKDLGFSVSNYPGSAIEWLGSDDLPYEV